MMMMMRMIVAVHVWCLQMRIEPVCELAFTFSLRLHTGPPSTSLITDWAKLFDWSAVTNCFTWITVWETACCIVWEKCKMQLENIGCIVWEKCKMQPENVCETVRENRLSKTVWETVWKLFETRFWGNVIYKACHKLFPMNNVSTVTDVSLIKITENFNGELLVPQSSGF